MPHSGCRWCCSTWCSRIVAVLGHRLRASPTLQQHTLEYELRRVRLEADEILQNIRSGVITVDADGRLAFINPTAERLLGLDGDRLLGRPILERAAALFGGAGSGDRARASGTAGKVSRGEGMVRARRAACSRSASPPPPSSRRIARSPSVTAIFTDISELKQLQELHLRAERLEAVAALSRVAGARDPQPAGVDPQLVRAARARARHASEDDQVLAGLIVRESDRLSRLLSEFLDFARVRATQLEPSTCSRWRRMPARRGAGAPRLPGRRPRSWSRARRRILEGDEDLLHRVVANLVLNAVQAARGPAGPRDGPRRRRCRRTNCPTAPTSSRPCGSQVGDDGPGIPEEIADRLFQPFVSGRPGGSGPRTRHRAARRRGASRPRVRGVQARAGHHVHHPASRPRHGGGSRMSQKPAVLVVDDESGILDTLRILLRNEGFEVTTAQGGKAGLEADPRRRARHRAHRRADAAGLGHRHPDRRARAGRDDAGHPDDGAGLAADRHPGGEQRGLLLHPEAVLQRRAGRDPPPGLRVPRGPGGEQAAEAGDPPPRPERRRSRPIGKSRRFLEVLKLAEHVAPTDSHGADPGRERHRQGGHRALHPRPVQPRATGRSSPSTAAPCPRACWRASCSAT